MQRFYTAIIEKAKDGFGVFFPDLPGCTSFGRSVEDAASNAFTAAQAHVALAREYGDPIAEPRAPDKIPAERGVKEKARLLIPVEMSEESVRVNISLPGVALEALDRTAKELSLSRSGAIAYLALETNSQVRKPISMGVSQRIPKLSFSTIWNRIEQHAGEKFNQLRGKSFRYSIRHGALVPDTTNRQIPKSNFESALSLLPLEGTSALQNLQGPSYIYAILMDERIRAEDW